MRNQKRLLIKGFFLAVALIMYAPFSITAKANANETLSVNGILFTKPDCRRCARIVREILPEFKKKYGDRLNVMIANNANPKAGNIYMAALFDLNIPAHKKVPVLIVGDRFLDDPSEIRRELPDIIVNGLSEGGIDWPAINGLDELLAEINGLPESEQNMWFISDDPSALRFLISDTAYNYNRDPEA